jgi:hypothetical protein
MDYPYYLVEVYKLKDYKEACMLAQAIADRTGRVIHLSEKLDQHTDTYSLQTFKPCKEEQS